MSDEVLGILAIIVGVIFCFGGYWVLRYVIALWGAFAGFGIGAGLVATINNQVFLANALGWVVGLVLALVFAVFAYLYYAVAVILSMGSIGFALGSALATALGASDGWLVILVGLVLGIVVALLALAFNLPMMLLVFLSAAGGATVVVAGAMLITGALDRTDLTTATTAVRSEWWWYAVYLALFVAGLVTQARRTAVRGRPPAAWQPG